MNETGRRNSQDRRQQAVPVAEERRKVKRRRQIDPTTCEREYNASEIEFMQAMDEYKHASGRMFPTCSEILEVIIKLGYRQIEEPGEIYQAELEDALIQQAEVMPR
ncbi:MAG: hypothetical protein MK108_00745 [Mariniblastus sp.]|nr:hypothetical protein [Mariniblastus sp.]